MARLEISLTGEVPEEGCEYLFTLSRRNLLALLHKLDMPGSARTITCGYVYVDGILLPAGRVEVLIRCESDTEHYAGREPQGQMHPDTEAFIEEHNEDRF